MKLKRVIPTLTVTAACALGSVPVASAATSDSQQASSENWSGYVAAGSSGDSTESQQSFKSVTGSWVQPKATCSSSTGSTYGAFWVGLGGAQDSQSLEQDGTEVNCSVAGKASYYAWYELVPSAPVKVDLAVHPGDAMTATTSVDGDRVTESIVNHTTGRSFSKTLTMSDPDTSSAEWIAEAPSACSQSASDCSPLALTDFGTVKFTAATATDSAGHTGSISDGDWSNAALTLSPGVSSEGFTGASYTDAAASSGGATPSSLSSDGSAFSVAYEASGDGDAGSTGDGSAGGDGGYGYGSTGGDGGYGSTGGYGSAGGYGYGGYGYGGYGYGGYGSDGGYGSTSGYGADGSYGGDGAESSGGYVYVYPY